MSVRASSVLAPSRAASNRSSSCVQIVCVRGSFDSSITINAPADHAFATAHGRTLAAAQGDRHHVPHEPERPPQTFVAVSAANTHANGLLEAASVSNCVQVLLLISLAIKETPSVHVVHGVRHPLAAMTTVSETRPRSFNERTLHAFVLNSRVACGCSNSVAAAVIV